MRAVRKLEIFYNIVNVFFTPTLTKDRGQVRNKTRILDVPPPAYQR